MSTRLFQTDLEFPDEILSRTGRVSTLIADGLPPAYPAEAETFARHDGVPGHNQTSLAKANIVLAGAGGLNGLTALGLLRSGGKYMTVIDPDIVERTNMPRQLYLGEDLGQPKAIRLIENLRKDAIAGATLTGIALTLEEAFEKYVLPVDLLVVGVDRNDCRKFAVDLARQRHIPAVFTMLSRDGMRCQSFLQGRNPEDACLWCALPNLDPDRASPCASAIITSCMLASSFAIFFAHRALMGWPENITPFNFREADLLGVSPDRIGMISQRTNCKICGHM